MCGGDIILKEEKSEGTISWKTYMNYLFGGAGKYIIPASYAVLILMIVSTCITLYNHVI